LESAKGEEMNFRLDYAEIEKRKEKKKEKKETHEKKERISIVGKRVVVTGAVPGLTRSQVTRWIESKGAYPQATVLTNTNYLLIGNTRRAITSNIVAARRIGVPIINISDIKENIR
jgi:NAD-dependent DNA ligase